jgi:hypothetical protein
VVALVAPAFMRARESPHWGAQPPVVAFSERAPDALAGGPAAPSGPSAEMAPQARMASPGASAEAPSARPPAASVPSTHPGCAAGQTLIVRTADLSLEVKDFQKAYDQAVSICESAGGYVTNSSAEAEETTPTWGTLAIRVPVQAFDRTVERLGKLGVVKSRNVTGEDVTGEVVDLESRLRNKRAEEQQYLEIMNRAHRVADVVTVSNELYRVRGEIEETQGRLKYLKSAAAMSTINLTLNENRKAKPLPVSSIGRALSNAWESLTRTAKALAVIAVWLGVYSPFWLLPLAIVLYVRRRAAAATR